MNGAPDLPEWAGWVVAVLVFAGAAITLTGTIGLVRLKSFYDRVHAPTLGSTLGIACILTASIVCFSVLQSRLVLHEISFTAEPGQTVALVGHTGSGKSSIINLIAKFYLPTSGRLLIDGHEIRDLQTDSLHRQLGIVLQHNFLFSGTVLDNIRIGRPSATDQEVAAAARRRPGIWRLFRGT